MKLIWSTSLVVAVVTAALGAQSANGMQAPKMHDSTHAMKSTLTGCVAAASQGDSILLTHVADASMKDDAMKHDDMKQDEMKQDSMMHDDHMMANDVVLTGPADLKKHIGQKVTVTGDISKGMSDGMAKTPDTLTVSSLKVLAKSCS